ncbi:hypothetical protein CTI12_AA018420 [Artemisia annua]|uniref:Nucleotide-binding, alpha-beta plait n=1 Tax=Artemisia annua TaxID=35608 RepID=A0A2U1QKL0_ARTAN|nr:hypothetical protein CTI12_AA018420 [Artemisia annua]
MCRYPSAVLEFAFLEFTDEEGAKNALSQAETLLGHRPVRVLPSKTAMIPVNPTFFTSGPTIKLMGDSHHSTRIAFVKFLQVESAIAALNGSDAFLEIVANKVHLVVAAAVFSPIELSLVGFFGLC